jgi:uncharacterized lipoprotein YddW (UPF0748 family)
MFVNRFEYAKSSASINAIMQQAADLGITDVMFQVRGRADAYYDSQFEPKAASIPSGFDPLQTAIDAAHSRGLKIHAWMNSLPLWQANAGTPPTEHIFHNTDPSFRLMDINGNLEPMEGWSNYSGVNPVLPEVHAHISNVVTDIASNYNVDGIHLDYIRHVAGNNFNRLPHDPISHQMFADATGLDGSNSANAAVYRNFVKNRITDLVATLGNAVDDVETASGRTIEYSASVWRDPDVGENDYLQDYRTWLENDLLDIVMPMIYLDDSNDHLFNPNLQNSLNVPSNSRVVPIIGTYLHTATGGGPELTVSQLQRANQFGADGAAFYGYGALFTDALAAERRAAITAFYESLVPVPGQPGNVIDDFELDEGHFRWPYNQSPVSQTFGLAATTAIDRTTDEAQRGIASQRLDLVASGASDWQIRHNSGLATPAVPASNAPLEATGYVGFWLKTETAGVEVRIAIDDETGAPDVGHWQSVIADGQWRLYQWNLDDANHWFTFAGDAAGLITASTVTIDSILFSGNGDAEIFLDTVSHNPDGPLAAAPLPGDFNADGSVDGDDLAVWKEHFGTATGAEVGEGDADGDGDVDGGDFLVWQQGVGGGGSGAAEAVNAVPEPAGLGLLALGGAIVAVARPRS